MTKELLELNQIRLDEDLTHEELAAQIGIERTTLSRLLSEPNRGMHDRTLHKIRRFLEERQTTPRRKTASVR